MNQERQAARSTRVLILDEDRVEGGMLAFHLRREGLVVMLMTSAEEAADAIAWAEPDVLLVEVSAQGFDGRQFLAQLSHLAVDVFAVTDRQLPAEVELDALRLGVIDIMMKPIDPVTLARRLRERPPRTRRGSVAGLPEGGISGELAVHSVVHLLQMAHRHRLNLRLHAEIAGDWAVLLVRHGEVIDAEAPSATGREAVYQIIRASQGSFVLFPLPPEAEELSRDDVIRADLATLVADAMGRREPRAVNLVHKREPDSYVLPHVGSPRGPLAGRGTDDETLEYAAHAAQAARAGEGPRVRRPGERERAHDKAEGGPPAKPVPPQKPRPPTHPGISAVPPAIPKDSPPGPRRSTDPQVSMLSPAVPSLHGQQLGGAAAGDGRAGAASEEAFPVESPTVDEGFDEATDQVERRRSRATMPGSKRTVSGSMPAVQNSAIRRTSTGSTGSGLRPAVRSGEAERGGGIPIDGDDYREQREAHFGAGGGGGRQRRRGATGGGQRWSAVTMVLAGAVAVLAVFIVVRLATREPPGPPELGDDATLLLGKALVDLDEGRRDEGRTTLATLASDRDAASEVLAPLAKLHYRDGRLLEAQALFERLVDKNPGDPEALAWLGLVQAERKDMERARESFLKALPNARGELAVRLRWLVEGQRGAAAPARGP